MLCKTNECLSMFLISHKGGGFALFDLYGVVLGGSTSFRVVVARSNLFWLVTTCSRSFRFYKQRHSHNVLTCNFTKNGLLLKFDHKAGELLLQIRAALLYYKVMQVVLQSTAGITKWDFF